MVFPHTDIKDSIFLHQLTCISLDNEDNDTLLKLKKHIYGRRDAGRAWWEFLLDGLTEMRCCQTETDQFVFIKYDVIILICVDDCVTLSKDKHQIEDNMTSLKKRHTITDEGNLEEYL